jgi:putative ABC transport system substrate-binding protein
MTVTIGRRELLAALGGAAAAWPLAARAQQSAMPVIGFMRADTPEASVAVLAAFRQGLSESGYVEKQNVSIEYRWAAQDHYDQLPALAADLVGRKVSVIAATTTPAALATKTATARIPIVFETGLDPIKLGLVATLNRPGGNITGVTQLSSELLSKRLGLLHDVLPAAATIGFLVDPTYPGRDSQARELEEAARTLGLQVQVLNAGTDAEIDTAFANFAKLGVGALFVGAGTLFTRRAEQLTRLAAALCAAYILSVSRVRRGWRSHQLRGEPHRFLSSSRYLYWPNPQGREAGRPAHFAADQVRAGHQPENSQGARSHNSAGRARDRRRGD